MTGRWVPIDNEPDLDRLILVSEPEEGYTLYWSPYNGLVYSYTAGYGGRWRVLHAAGKQG